MSESIEKNDASQTNITVKFKINNFETVAQVYTSITTIRQILIDIASKFQLSPKYLAIQHEDNVIKLSNSMQLQQICENSFGIVNVQLLLSDLAKQINENISNDCEKIKLDSDIYYRQYQLPDFISVAVVGNNDDEPKKRLIVEIINIPIVKPFLGGYVNKLSSIEYHNAYTQTGPIFSNKRINELVTRDTQTSECRTASSFINASYERQTQTVNTNKSNTYSAFAERIIEPKTYISYNDEKKIEIEKIILIQKNFRRYLWQKLIRKSAKEWRKLKSEQDQLKATRNQSILDKFIYKCELKRSPRSKDDFKMLLVNLRKWKEFETKRIKELYPDEHRSVKYNLLLEHEIKLINEIEAKRLEIHKKLIETQREKKLDALGTPVKWIGYKNINCEMDLLRTQKIRKITTLYRKLKSPMNKLDRIEFISSLAEILKIGQYSSTSKALIELLEQEVKLLIVDINDTTLMALRKRQIDIFVEFISEGKLYVAKASMANTKTCTKCKLIRSLKDYEINTREGENNICKMCNSLQVATDDVLSTYKTILRSIRRDERKRNAISSCAFIIQEKDIQVIVEQIWHGHSILSQNNNLASLRLPRWNKALDWSPWNCICLTESETLAHLIIKNLDQTYGESFRNVVRYNHQLARNRFKKLNDIDLDFVETGEWNAIGLNKMKE